MYDLFVRRFNKAAKRYRVGHNVPYGDDERQVVDVYAPKGAKKAKVVIFWPGGSWQRGDKKTQAFVAEPLVEAGMVVVIANYRFYPSVHFPAFVEDGADAIEWVMKYIDAYGGDPHSIYLMGHSAGAHIAALLAYDRRYRAKRAISSGRIRGCIGIAGPYDFYPRPTLRPIFDLRDPDKPWNPIDNITDPTVPGLLLHGRLDFTVWPSNSKRYAEAIRRKGGKVTLKLYPLEHLAIILAFSKRFRWLAPVIRDCLDFIETN